ncbi:MAG: hypothetical protein H7308_18610 [Chthonomonadaceae bacterium]|nr:hypothetical protein [Chthonomonadaceae bacterium]
MTSSSAHKILTHFLTTILMLVALALTTGAEAQQYSITLRATRYVLLSNGREKTQVRAEVRDLTGKQTGSLEVQFSTTLGVLSQNRAQTFGGVAQVELSATVAGIAKVTASVRGAVTDPIEVSFTDDAEALYQGKGYVEISGKGYLAYSVAEKVIEASGKGSGAKVKYRNIEISADRLYLSCEGLIVRAQGNVILKRGKESVTGNRLVYRLSEGSGFGIVNKDGNPQLSEITGQNLRIGKMETPLPNSYLLLPTLQSKLVIAARGITFFPGDRLIFSKPKVLQDGQLIYTAAYHQMRLDSPELFAEQFISVGTNGFGLDLPVYYNLTANGSGTVYLRNQQQQGRSYFAQNNGFSMDVVQSYNQQGDRSYEGAYGFTGLTRGDWSFRFLHNQEFGNNSQGGISIDFPQHTGVYTNANFNQQQRKMRWGFNASGGKVWSGLIESSLRSDLYAETQPRQLLGSRDLMYTLGSTLTTSNIRSQDAIIGTRNQNTEQLTLRTYARPRQLDPRTTLSNSFTVGQVWQSRGQSGIASTASVTLDRLINGGGTLGLSYDFVNQPSGDFVPIGHHRFGMSYNVNKGRRFDATVFGSLYADSTDATLYADMSYRLTKDWRFLFSGTYSNYDTGSFRDLQFTIGRRIGARELQFTYSTFNKRISFDLTATRF